MALTVDSKNVDVDNEGKQVQNKWIVQFFISLNEF